jgi:hypothetical protein
MIFTVQRSSQTYTVQDPNGWQTSPGRPVAVLEGAAQTAATQASRWQRGARTGGLHVLPRYVVQLIVNSFRH